MSPHLSENRRTLKNRSLRKRAVVSACLLGFRCRYDGVVREYDIRRILRAKGYIIVSVCPEMEIGLGVPRRPIRIIAKGKHILLIQKSTGARLKRRLEGFSVNFLKKLKRVDLFILKSRSPSCGNGDCKVFRNLRDEDIAGYSDGIFAKMCKEIFPDVPVFNEENFIRRLSESIN